MRRAAALTALVVTTFAAGVWVTMEVLDRLFGGDGLRISCRPPAYPARWPWGDQ